MFPNYFGNKKQERYQTHLFLKKLEIETGTLPYGPSFATNCFLYISPIFNISLIYICIEVLEIKTNHIRICCSAHMRTHKLFKYFSLW